MIPFKGGAAQKGCAGRGTLPSGTVAGLPGHLAAWVVPDGAPETLQRAVHFTPAGRYSITVGETSEGPLVPQQLGMLKAAS